MNTYKVHHLSMKLQKKGTASIGFTEAKYSKGVSQPKGHEFHSSGNYLIAIKYNHFNSFTTWCPSAQQKIL
jgi:hypothetical protein